MILSNDKKIFIRAMVHIILLFGFMIYTATPIAKSESADSSINNHKPNMVDERFELVSLVFRLAGRQEYSEEITAYQKEISETFAGFRNHPIVHFAKTLPLGYDAVFRFAVHMIKEDGQFAFIEDIDSLVDDGRWTKETANIFIDYLNDFYVETDYAGFYNSRLPFFEKETEKFIRLAYSYIDLSWFDTYVDSNSLRCIYTPSATKSNYAAVVNQKYVYCGVAGAGGVIVHEFCHSFSNPLARKWYEENEVFRQWCDESVKWMRDRFYADALIVVGEYVTRAYHCLYNLEHGYFEQRNALSQHFKMERSYGFRYFEDVFNMVVAFENER